MNQTVSWIAALERNDRELQRVKGMDRKTEEREREETRQDAEAPGWVIVMVSNE